MLGFCSVYSSLKFVGDRLRVFIRIVKKSNRKNSLESFGFLEKCIVDVNSNLIRVLGV